MGRRHLGTERRSKSGAGRGQGGREGQGSRGGIGDVAGGEDGERREGKGRAGGREIEVEFVRCLGTALATAHGCRSPASQNIWHHVVSAQSAGARARRPMATGGGHGAEGGERHARYESEDGKGRERSDRWMQIGGRGETDEIGSGDGFRGRGGGRVKKDERAVEGEGRGREGGEEGWG